MLPVTCVFISAGQSSLLSWLFGNPMPSLFLMKRQQNVRHSRLGKQSTHNNYSLREGYIPSATARTSDWLLKAAYGDMLALLNRGTKVKVCCLYPFLLETGCSGVRWTPWSPQLACPRFITVSIKFCHQGGIFLYHNVFCSMTAIPHLQLALLVSDVEIDIAPRWSDWGAVTKEGFGAKSWQ